MLWMVLFWVLLVLSALGGFFYWRRGKEEGRFTLTPAERRLTRETKLANDQLSKTPRQGSRVPMRSMAEFIDAIRTPDALSARNKAGEDQEVSKFAKGGLVMNKADHRKPFRK